MLNNNNNINNNNDEFHIKYNEAYIITISFFKIINNHYISIDVACNNYITRYTYFK